MLTANLDFGDVDGKDWVIDRQSQIDQRSLCDNFVPFDCVFEQYRVRTGEMLESYFIRTGEKCWRALV